MIKTFTLLCLLAVSYSQAHHRNKPQGHSLAANDTGSDTSPCPEETSSHLQTGASTLENLGGLTVDMVKALAGDRDSREVNLKDLTNLVSALAESSLLVDNPRVSLGTFHICKET